MQKIREYLLIDEGNINTKAFMLLLIVAYAFSIAVRLIWVQYLGDNIQSIWNDQIMLNTNDGYYWAEGARDILKGESYYQASPVNSSISVLTAFFADILPVSFESVILYMPVVLGSLIVIPIMLIGKALQQPSLGFVAALIASIAWSYYNRTMAGYYDTDMLIIVLPTFVLWSIILGVTHKRNRYLLALTATMILYNVWYPGSYSLNLAIAGVLFVYTLLVDRKSIFNYKLLLFSCIAIANLPISIKIAVSILLFAFFHYLREQVNKFVIPLLIVSFMTVFVTVGFDPVLAQLNNYIFRDQTVSASDIALKFFSVVQTVREAGDIPFETFANRISGHPITFILSTVGYVLMTIRFPVMLLALPMVGLGFMAYLGGLRFTVYTVPINALGMAFLIILISQYIAKSFKANQKAAHIIVALISTAAVLYPNIKHVKQYMVPTVFNRDEVAVLDRLNDVATSQDYVLAWWDYGYPIRYYSETKTLIDGAKHDGYQNFSVSLALTNGQTESANMARLATEYNEKSYETKQFNLLKTILKDYGYSDPNVFLNDIKSKEFVLPEKTAGIYYYLPLRMLDIYQTVRLFSNLDLTSGKSFARPFFYETQYFQDLGDKLKLGRGVELDKRTNQIHFGNQIIPINSLYVTAYTSQRDKLQVQKQLFDFTAPLSIIYMKSYNRFLVVDQQTLNSTYFQLFVLEQYDPDLFEPVIMTPLAKVYRLKK